MVKQQISRINRRGFLQRSPLFLGSLALAACRRAAGPVGDRAGATGVQAVANSTKAASPSTKTLALTPACGDRSITPAQTPGPFYSPNSPLRQSLVEPDTVGARIVVTGRVLSQDCQPLAGCLLDFWQTDAEGNYDNQGYGFRGHQFTDGQGGYRLSTVVPGRYPGRTRHLHVRVQPKDGPILTTQLYLPQEPLNQQDGLFQPELLMLVGETEVGRQAQFDFVVETLG